ncbi:MAG: sigma-70 family RNA polymerase sigma factor [Bryobacteraceae bacterium]|nr:sigma-70 family RNA polymerase sigma factor [Bryobacteraceae bacterium]
MTEVAPQEDTAVSWAGTVAGDSDAFARIVREHQAMVFSLALHCLGDRASAEDLSQDVFLQLHRNLDQIESPAHLKFWLRKVASHRAIDAARRRRWWPKFGLDEIPEPAIRTPAADPLLMRRLAKVVKTLPETQRVIVVLRYQEDMDPSEIAQVLEMPVATVKSYLHRALEMLRKKLGGKKE